MELLWAKHFHCEEGCLRPPFVRSLNVRPVRLRPASKSNTVPRKLTNDYKLMDKSLSCTVDKMLFSLSFE